MQPKAQHSATPAVTSAIAKTFKARSTTCANTIAAIRSALRKAPITADPITVNPITIDPVTIDPVTIDPAYGIFEVLRATVRLPAAELLGHDFEHRHRDLIVTRTQNVVTFTHVDAYGVTTVLATASKFNYSEEWMLKVPGFEAYGWNINRCYRLSENPEHHKLKRNIFISGYADDVANLLSLAFTFHRLGILAKDRKSPHQQ